ncbi:MAG: hypothetical protein WCT10_01860 [Patescibacteria group bacterium]|jgi:hypothetical protein
MQEEKQGRSGLSQAASALFALILVLPAPALATSIFNPQLILTDAEMRDADALSYSEIADFLNSKGGFGSCFDADAIDGLLKGTAQLVADAAQRYEINPKYILALIQKESSAVESTKPNQKQLDWAAGYALCDGCKKTSPLAVKYKGLGKQIDVGAGWMDWFMDNHEQLGHMVQPGETVTISRTKVTPVNLTTAALYNYTPHLHGNRLLWSIWNRWFGDNLGLRFPDGTLVRNEKTGAVALIQNGKFRPITSRSVLESRFNAAIAIDLNEYDFGVLQDNAAGKPVKFADLSLLRVEDGTIYLLLGAAKRPIASAAVFAAIGFNPEEVEEAAAADLEDYLTAEPITLASAYPTGQLVQNNETGGVYYAEAGVKHPIWDKAVLAANYPGRKIQALSPAELEKLVLGEPVRLADGVLVKTPDQPSVFVISNGKKLPIPTEEVFVAYGYKWENIITAPARVLELHETGEPLMLVSETVTATMVGL